jgi:hypothetical protein
MTGGLGGTVGVQRKGVVLLQRQRRDADKSDGS